jgi:hypothetical protein
MPIVRSIIQIIPAGTWKARFDPSKRKPVMDVSLPVGGSGFFKDPLVCWAIVETSSPDRPNRAVVGMIQALWGSDRPGELLFADEEAGFVVYDPN